MMPSDSSPPPRWRRRRVSPWALALVAIALASCTNARRHEPPPGVHAIAPLPQSREVAGRWYRQWADQPDALSDTRVRDALLNVYVPSASGGRTPDMPPGYIAQLVLVDVAANPQRNDGVIQAVLVARPQESTAEALMAWEIDPRESEARYRRMFVEGFLLPLNWDAPPEHRGEFMLIVRWTDDESRARLTRNILFQDAPSHARTLSR
jgi:hypothetical protein